MKEKLLIVAFILFIHPSFSQPYADIISIQGFQSESENFILDRNKDIEFNWSSIQLTLPKLFKDSSLLAFTPGYDNWGIRLNANDLSLHTAYLPITYLKRISAHSRIAAVFIPRFNAATQINVDDKTMQYGGALVYTWRKNKDFAVKGGLYYNREFFGNYFLPLAGIDWKINDRLYLFGLFPNNLFLDYALHKNFHAGFSYKGITTSFLLEEDQPDYFSLEEGQVKLFADFYILKNFVFNIEAGYQLARTIGFGERNEDVEEIKFNNGYLIKAGLYYRIWTN
jgi:hypothetical protein